jgi:hypothetical protein
MSARYYSPGLGAFTSIDSVMGGAQNPLSLNRYLYALANPATLQDPSGHYACSGNDPDCKYLQASVKVHEKIRHSKVMAKRERENEDEVTRRHRGATNKKAAPVTRRDQKLKAENISTKEWTVPSFDSFSKMTLNQRIGAARAHLGDIVTSSDWGDNEQTLTKSLLLSYYDMQRSVDDVVVLPKRPLSSAVSGERLSDAVKYLDDRDHSDSALNLLLEPLNGADKIGPEGSGPGGPGTIIAGSLPLTTKLAKDLAGAMNYPNVHALKKDFFGLSKNGSKFDLYRDEVTGVIDLRRKLSTEVGEQLSDWVVRGGKIVEAGSIADEAPEMMSIWELEGDR